MNDSEKLAKAKSLIAQIMRNYQVAASIANNEGYETNYEQDKVLADFFLNEESE